MSLSVRNLAIATAVSVLTMAPSAAQGPCSEAWRELEGVQPGVSRFGPQTPAIRCAAVHDDGTGPALFVAGSFSFAGNSASPGVAKWNGQEWSALTAPFSPELAADAMLSADLGAGPRLFLGGAFDRISNTPALNIGVWNGVAWNALGSGLNSNVIGMARMNEGGSPHLFACGYFTASGGTSLSRIARWNGTTWSSVGGGLNGFPTAMTVWPTSSGDKLVVVGDFTAAGGVPASRIAVWDGTSWSQLGAGLSSNGGVWDITTFDDGSGPTLFLAAAEFSFSTIRVAKWTGTTWVDAAPNTPITVSSPSFKRLRVANDGAGPALYATGQFHTPQSSPFTVENVLKLSNGAWQPIAPNIKVEGSSGPPLVTDIDGLPTGPGRGLYAVGRFEEVDNALGRCITVRKQNQWRPLSNGFNGPVLALVNAESGPLAGLYAGGRFSAYGGQRASGVARKTPSGWSEVGPGLAGPCVDLAFGDFNGQPVLAAAGSFKLGGSSAVRRVVAWNASQWIDLDADLSSAAIVTKVALVSSGPASGLYVAGQQLTTLSGTGLGNIARWTPGGWAPLGFGLSFRPERMISFDDGTGPKLYAAGNFSVASSNPGIYDIARWDGSAWSGLGVPQFATSVNSLAVHNPGNGAAPVLLAGGFFSSSGMPGLHDGVAQWNGTQWTPVGNEMEYAPSAILSVFDGTTQRIFAASHFNNAITNYWWNVGELVGNQWVPRHSGMTHVTYALAWSHDPQSRGLLVGGDFRESPTGDSYLARWGCESPPRAFCTSQGPSATLGCVASISADAHPTISNSTPCTIVVSNVEAGRSGMFFYGLSGQMDQPWCSTGAVRLCVAPPVQRVGAQTATGTPGACGGQLSLAWSQAQLARPTLLGNPWLAGVEVDLQAWIRDPAACGTTSLTPGINLVYR